MNCIKSSIAFIKTCQLSFQLCRNPPRLLFPFWGVTSFDYFPHLKSQLLLLMGHPPGDPRVSHVVFYMNTSPRIRVSHLPSLTKEIHTRSFLVTISVTADQSYLTNVDILHCLQMRLLLSFY